MKNKEKHYMYAMGQKVEVTRDFHKEFESMENATNYRDRLYLQNSISWDDCMEQKNAVRDNDILYRSAEDDMIRAEMLRKLRKAVACLDEEDSFIIEKLIFDELSCGKVGKMLGISKQAVAQRRDVIFRRLKKIVEA